MEKTTQNILLSEMYSATAYIDRIFHALLDVTSLGLAQTGRTIGNELFNALNQFIQQELVRDKFEYIPEAPKDMRSVREGLHSSKMIMEGMIKTGLNGEGITDSSVKFINLLYHFAHELHVHIEENTELEIQFPRVNLIEVHYDHDDSFEEQLSSYNEDEWEGDESVPKFYLNKQALVDLLSTNVSPVSNLDWQRSKKYDMLLQEGHEAVFKKDLDKALNKFTKAMNYKDTAEILTLVAWVHSMKQNTEKAKSLCLKAIQKDPDYGPPYNDLGTYLLTEGEVDESLKWFNLAKKAVNYQNREYPYINSGRAWMAKKNFEKALDEFSKALTLAPFHEELHQTVEKLKTNLRGKEDNHFEHDNPPF